MITPIISIYDRAVLSYMSPFTVRTVGEAKRQLLDTVRDPTHAFSQHPSDYDLVQLGTFNDSNGTIESFKQPVLLMKVSEATSTNGTDNGQN